jgi:hypothetical protein
LNFQADIERRLRVRDQDEWAAKWSTYYVWSVDDEFSIVDPWVNTISLPYTYKTVWKAKGTQITFTPGLESILMDNNEDGSRENIQNSIIGNADVTIINKDNWFSTYAFEIRSEDSLLPSENSEDNADGLKYSLRTYQTRLLDATKTRALLGSVGLVFNDSKGSENSYRRYELGATYASPLKSWKNTSWTLALNTYRQEFFDANDSREDLNLSLTYSLTKTINEKWAFVGIGSYSNNNSSVDASQYTKYQVTTQAVYAWLE